MNALLITDTEAQAPLPRFGEEDPFNNSDVALIRRDGFAGFPSKKLRHRLYYLKDLRFRHNKTEWNDSVAWALNYIKDHPRAVALLSNPPKTTPVQEALEALEAKTSELGREPTEEELSFDMPPSTYGVCAFS